MGTISSMGILVIIGVVANFLWVFVGNLAGLPGALLGGLRATVPVWRVRIGIVAAFLGQAYVGLAFSAWVTAWTRLAADRPGVSGVFLWPVAFMAVAGPVWVTLIRARIEAREHSLGRANVQVVALHFTAYAVVLGFVTFGMFPRLAATGWFWVPLVTAAATR